MRVLYGGLVERGFFGRGRPATLPGWTAVKDYDKGCWLVMPWWMRPVVHVHRHWKGMVAEPLMRAGIIEVAEGDYYANYRFAPAIVRWSMRTAA